MGVVGTGDGAGESSALLPASVGLVWDAGVVLPNSGESRAFVLGPYLSL